MDSYTIIEDYGNNPRTEFSSVTSDTITGLDYVLQFMARPPGYANAAIMEKPLDLINPEQVAPALTKIVAQVETNLANLVMDMVEGAMMPSDIRRQPFPETQTVIEVVDAPTELAGIISKNAVAPELQPLFQPPPARGLSDLEVMPEELVTRPC
jgi:hypothetical protein